MQDEVQLTVQYTALKGKVISDISRLRRIQQKLEETKLDLASTQDCFHYTLNGRAGQVCIGDGIFILGDLENGLIDLPPEIDNPKSEGIRKHQKATPIKSGSSQWWTPNGTSLIQKSYLTKLRKSATIVKKLEDLFSGEKSLFSRGAQSIMAAYNLHNYGGSDESTEMITAGAYDGLFYGIGFKCDSSRLGKGCPSQRSIKRSIILWWSFVGLERTIRATKHTNISVQASITLDTLLKRLPMPSRMSLRDSLVMMR